jgi:hypothetical protein
MVLVLVLMVFVLVYRCVRVTASFCSSPVHISSVCLLLSVCNLTPFIPFI